MPELPEVETTVKGLKKILPHQHIIGVWTDLAKKGQHIQHFKNTLKDLSFYKKFKKEVVDKKIIGVKRRAKNILIDISNKETILIHMKMTGHLMIGKYSYDSRNNSWAPSQNEKNEALSDPFNRFIHVVFSLSDGKQLVFCDSRKFGTVKLISSNELDNHFNHLGPEALDSKFTFKKFSEQLYKKPTGKIKQVLMDQSIISGIGNIYSDEMLWLTTIHPKELVKNIPEREMKKLFAGMKEVLRKGINFGGDSTSDYRNINGQPGKFSHHHNAYRLTGKPCGKQGCKGVILRTVVGARSAHYCSEHQKLRVY